MPIYLCPLPHPITLSFGYFIKYKDETCLLWFCCLLGSFFFKYDVTCWLVEGGKYYEDNRKLSDRGGQIGGQLTKRKEQGRDMGTAWCQGNSFVRREDWTDFTLSPFQIWISDSTSLRNPTRYSHGEELADVPSDTFSIWYLFSLHKHLSHITARKY